MTVKMAAPGTQVGRETASLFISIKKIIISLGIFRLEKRYSCLVGLTIVTVSSGKGRFLMTY